MTVALAPLSQIEQDLALLRLQLVARLEDCSCRGCQALDRQFDADLLAVDEDGRPLLIAHRRQPQYAYHTITVRSLSDRGGRDVQGAKLTIGRSMASIYIQSYADWLMVIGAADLISGLIAPRSSACSHPYGEQAGSESQRFYVVCDKCSAARTINRNEPPVSLPVRHDGLLWTSERAYRRALDEIPF